MEAYNTSGIWDKTPPPGVSALAEECEMIVTSDLLRSMESGRVLAAGRPVIADALFREAGLPYGPAFFFRMPPPVWAGLFRLFWFAGFEANGESVSEFRKRARQAANSLVALAREHGSVLLVGHGFINRSIARELLASDWRGPAMPRSHHWACAVYTK